MNETTYKYVVEGYESGVWPKKWVWDAVTRWITAEQYKEITGDEWDPENRPK